MYFILLQKITEKKNSLIILSINMAIIINFNKLLKIKNKLNIKIPTNSNTIHKSIYIKHLLIKYKDYEKYRL